MKIPSQTRMYRDLDSGVISGVCAGVARYFDIDAVWVRAAAVVSLFVATPITIVAYIAAVILLPRMV
jgi:phage shock protein PspC (stress-responsive transcriptional regulator)